MPDYREQIRDVMFSLGEDALVPAEEETEGSKWATEDVAPGGVPGYYVRKRLPLPHKILTDGRTAALRFSRGEIRYKIRCRHESTQEGNLRAVMYVLGTLLAWIDHEILTWDEAFYGFRIEEEDQGAWWQVLRAPPDATVDEIEDAYKRQARKVHPDHGGTHEAFLHLQEAYQVAKNGIR